MQTIASMSIIPVVGWIISAILAVLMAIPFFFLWGWLGPTYFSFVPKLYLEVGFLDMAGLLILIGFIKLVVFPVSFNKKA